VNDGGQFSIIAALLVAVILIATVITTYSAIRYSSIQDQPQVLTAIDEINLALKRILGFTVGYYGSVLQVTGNSSYAKTLSSNYLTSGLENIGDVRPEWGTSFNVTALDLSTNWFTNTSYSTGHLLIKYDLSGLGVYGISYNASSRLDVQVLNSSSSSQACLSVFADENEPLNNLGKQNFKFYRYRYSNLTWGFVSPSGELTAFTNGTYLIDIPSGIDPSSYVVQVQDTRGLMVAASSFSRLTSTLMWNTTSPQGGDYVDINTTDVDSSPNKGTQSNFTAQQFGLDNINDTLTEGAFGTVSQPYYPTSWQPLGSTTLASGAIANLTSDDGVYMGFHSYASAYSGASDFGYKTVGLSTSDFGYIRGSRFTCASTGPANSITAYLSYAPPTGTFGTTSTGISGETIMDTIRGQRFTSPSYSVVAQSIEAYLDVPLATFGNINTGTNYQSISNYLRGSPFQAPETGTAQNISAYIYVTSTYRHIKAAIYTTTGTLVGSTSEVTGLSSGAQWVTFTFSGTKPSLTSGTTYILVVWADSGMSSVYLYYSSTSTNAGRNYPYTYQTNWPSPVTFNNDNNLYCIYCTYSSSKNMKAAIYDNSGNIVASTDQLSVPAGTSADWQTFTFASPPTLAASTQYILVVWSQSGSGSANLRYASGTGTGRYASQPYGNWPPSVTFSTNTRNYCIYCNYQQGASAQAAIYSSDGTSRLGITEEKTLTATTGSWVTFNFVTKPTLTASTNYVLMAWASDTSNVSIYYNTGTAEYFRQSATYPTWPSSVADQYSTRTYSIYCTVAVPSEYTCEVEFTGTANTQSWTQLAWTTDSKCTDGGVNVTVQLWNYQAGRYALSGEGGYNSTTIGTTDVTMTQTVTVNPTDFRENSTGNWKLKFKAVKSTSTQFDMNIDLARYSPGVPNYMLDIEEQWTNVNYAYPRQDLCIMTGNLSLNESLLVDVRVSSSWITVFDSLQPNKWNNVSVTPYISSQNFTIRFRDGNSSSDTNQTSWNIDAVLLSPQPDVDVLLSQLDHTIVVELLQNGAMRWLGQNLTTQEKPIPPIPVKAIHVNQTINGVDQEVPFQIEDWASEYRIPLGLTNSATVFSNRQMIVFLVNVTVSKVTVWWNGSDTATQTPNAYTNLYFKNDNPNVTQTTGFLTNGLLNLTIERVDDAIDHAQVFKVTSVVGTSSSTTKFMRINNENSTYGASSAYVIHHGIVRDIVQQEAEWDTEMGGGGAYNCPNVYASIVLTLPAKATYYTYQLRLMFIDSTQSRNITDLCPIKLTTSIDQLQTENGTINGIPIVANGSGNFSSSVWAHYWSQFISGSQGAGIMFTNASNQQLYVFDSTPPGTPTGALKTNNSTKTIELLPVTLRQVNFNYVLDVTWHGAVATFDSFAAPIYTMQGTAPTGLWLLVEYQPAITVTSES
jgi:hypothetical protein